MYSYYAFALLKISCPWKRFLTQAQLFQFTSVVIYSIVSYNSWPKDQVEPKHVLCIVIQVWEMVSLFVLFSFFYMKSYGKKMKKAADDDQCQIAVEAGVVGAVQAVESAAKSAGKIASSVQSNGVKFSSVSAMKTS